MQCAQCSYQGPALEDEEQGSLCAQCFVVASALVLDSAAGDGYQRVDACASSSSLAAAPALGGVAAKAALRGVRKPDGMRGLPRLRHATAALAAALGLTGHGSRALEQLCRVTLRSAALRNVEHGLVAAAVVVCACRMSQSPLTIAEVAARAVRSKAKVGKAFLKLGRVVFCGGPGGSLPRPDAAAMLVRLCSQMELPTRIAAAAMQLLDEAGAERSSAPALAAALLRAAENEEQQQEQQEQQGGGRPGARGGGGGAGSSTSAAARKRRVCGLLQLGQRSSRTVGALARQMQLT